jgi:hypothetical protein
VLVVESVTAPSETSSTRQTDQSQPAMGCADQRLSLTIADLAHRRTTQLSVPRSRLGLAVSCALVTVRSAEETVVVGVHLLMQGLADRPGLA